MKASKESSSRLCPLGDVPTSARRWGVLGVASGVYDPARASGGSRCGAPPACLRLRKVPGSPGGRRLRELWLRVAEFVLTPGVRSRSLRSRVRLASGQCLVASVCRVVRQVGTLH